MAHSKERNLSTKPVPEKTVSDILDKGFKTTIVKMLKELKEDMEKVKRTVSEQSGNINKEIENLKINQNKILELKSTITEMKIH